MYCGFLVHTVWISFYPTSCVFKSSHFKFNSEVIHLWGPFMFLQKTKTKWHFYKLHIRGFLEVSPGILCAQPSISLRLLTGPRGRDLLRYNVVCISASTIAGNFTFFSIIIISACFSIFFTQKWSNVPTKVKSLLGNGKN